MSMPLGQLHIRLASRELQSVSSGLTYFKERLITVSLSRPRLRFFQMAPRPWSVKAAR